MSNRPTGAGAEPMMHVRGVDPAVWHQARVWAVAHEYRMGEVVTWALAEFLAARGAPAAQPSEEARRG